MSLTPCFLDVVCDNDKCDKDGNDESWIEDFGGKILFVWGLGSNLYAEVIATEQCSKKLSTNTGAITMSGDVKFVILGKSILEKLRLQLRFDEFFSLLRVFMATFRCWLTRLNSVRTLQRRPNCGGAGAMQSQLLSKWMGGSGQKPS